jgi:hypothetical protein
VQTRREQLVIRVASLGAVAGSFALAALMHTPSTLPGSALGSGLLLFFERLAIVLAALLFPMAALYRGWHGELPHRLSERGAEWAPLVPESAELQRQLELVLRRVSDLELGFEQLTSTIEEANGES